MAKRFMSSCEIPFRKDAQGRPLCRWCGVVVTPPRRSWCSQECVDEFLMRSSAETMRAHIFRRDNGICEACGCDTKKIERVIGFADCVSYGSGWSVFVRLGFNLHQSLWEADHVVEVCNGGETHLDNMQTLCVPCHKQKTRKMHADRARARRGKQPPPEPATQIALIR